MLDGLMPKKLIAAGESQSAGRMVTYIDAVHPLVTSTTASSLAHGQHAKDLERAEQHLRAHPQLFGA